MEQKHSGLGLAALLISIIVGILIFAVFVVGGIMQVSTPGGLDENSPSALFIGLAIIALLGIDVIAVGLGIAALYQQDKKKVLAILGLVFSTVTVVGTIFLVVLGNTM